MVDIIEYTPDRLVLQKRNDSVGLFLLGGVGMLLVSCLVAYQTLRTTSLRCARGPAGLTCDATARLLGVIPLDRRRFEDVRGAFATEAGYSEDPPYWIELWTGSSSGTPLSDMTVNKWQCQFFAHVFNQFVDSGKQSDGFVQLPDVIGIAMLALLFAVALVCFAFALPYRLEVDGELGCLTIRDGIRRKLSHALADVEEVRVDEPDGDGHTLRGVFLLLKDGKRLPLAIEPDQGYLVADYVPRPTS